MARSTTTAQDAALAAYDRETHVRVKYEDADGTLQTIHDLQGTDYFDSLEIEADADHPISSATFRFWRSSGINSLAPLIEASEINRDSGGSYAPALNPVREITVEVATMLPGETPGASDYVLIWEGEIDSLDWADAQIVVECLDPITTLNRHIIQTVATYGDDGGSKNIDDVMQDILDAEFGASTWPLTVVGSPTLPIAEYELGNVSVLEALMALADLIGWSLHWKWDSSASEFRLTFYEPDRTNTTASYTFGPDDYYAVNRMGTGVRGIRNVGEVLYTDASGDQQSVSDTRSTSVADFGESFIRIDAQGSSITTSGQADDLLAAVLDDTEDPKIEQEIEAAFHWPIEIGDVHSYSANDVHYDTAQKWAAFGYRHVIDSDRVRTVISAAGKPSGGFARWLDRDTTTRRRPPGSRALASMEVTFNANGQAVVSAAGDEGTEAIYVTVGDGTEPDDPTATTNNGSIAGSSGTVDTGVKITTGKEAHVKAIAVSGEEFSRVASVRQARRLGAFHKDTTNRPTSGTSPETLETITVPANSLGSNGVLRITALFTISGSGGGKSCSLTFGGSGIGGITLAAAFTGQVWIECILTNDGATGSQDGNTISIGEGTSPVVDIDIANTSIDTTADADIEIIGDRGAGDSLALVYSMVEFLGTN